MEQKNILLVEGTKLRAIAEALWKMGSDVTVTIKDFNSITVLVKIHGTRAQYEGEANFNPCEDCFKCALRKALTNALNSYVADTSFNVERSKPVAALLKEQSKVADY